MLQYKIEARETHVTTGVHPDLSRQSKCLRCIFFPKGKTDVKGKRFQSVEGIEGNVTAEMLFIQRPLSKTKSKLLYDWRSVSQSICLGIGSILGLVTRYYFL
jgi:hypothetical protein